MQTVVPPAYMMSCVRRELNHKDIDSAVRVLEKQRLFAVRYYESGGHTHQLEEIVGAALSGGITRMLGQSESLWAHFERLGVVDEDAMRDCYKSAMTINWRSDDGGHSMHSPIYYYYAHKYVAALIAPEGTFELDALLGDCPEPEAPLLDDNTLFVW